MKAIDCDYVIWYGCWIDYLEGITLQEIPCVTFI